MAVNILTQVLNVVLDALLITALKAGVQAAALTSCISVAIGSVITLLLFTEKRLDLYYTRRNPVLACFSDRLLTIPANFSATFQHR